MPCAGRPALWNAEHIPLRWHSACLGEANCSLQCQTMEKYGSKTKAGHGKGKSSNNEGVLIVK
jgi:hypothetical protein